MTGSRARVIALAEDLFIQSRLAELAGLLGLETRFVTSEQIWEADLSEARLVILDLALPDYDIIGLVERLRTRSPGLKILGFYPHVRKDLEGRARSAGVDFVVPNSLFLQTTKQVLEKVS